MNDLRKRMLNLLGECDSRGLNHLDQIYKWEEKMGRIILNYGKTYQDGMARTVVMTDDTVFEYDRRAGWKITNEGNGDYGDYYTKDTKPGQAPGVTLPEPKPTTEHEAERSRDLTVEEIAEVDETVHQIVDRQEPYFTKKDDIKDMMTSGRDEDDAVLGIINPQAHYLNKRRGKK